jgi:hypothetical protein
MRKLLAVEGLIREDKRKGVRVLVERNTAERVAVPTGGRHGYFDLDWFGTRLKHRTAT